VLGSPDNFQFLERWLTNESMSLGLGGKVIEQCHRHRKVRSRCADPSGRLARRSQRAPSGALFVVRIEAGLIFLSLIVLHWWINGLTLTVLIR